MPGVVRCCRCQNSEAALHDVRGPDGRGRGRGRPGSVGRDEARPAPPTTAGRCSDLAGRGRSGAGPLHRRGGARGRPGQSARRGDPARRVGPAARAVRGAGADDAAVLGPGRFHHVVRAGETRAAPRPVRLLPRGGAGRGSPVRGLPDALLRGRHTGGLRLSRSARGRRATGGPRRSRPGDGDAGRPRRPGPPVRRDPEIRVGIHTGRVVVTDLSRDDSVAARDSIVGLVPNLSARIQQDAEPGKVMISDVTEHLVDADFYLRSLGERRLKGISWPVEVFAVERPRYAAARFLADRYRKAGLVGRDEPRARLPDAWEAVQRGVGTSAAFLVVGEPGIGKSRLSAEILDRVEASGGRVIGAACLPYYADVSLWPVARMFDRMLERVRNPGGRLGWLIDELRSVGLDPGHLVPFLGPLLGISATADHPAPELDPSAFLDETLERLVDWLAAVARGTPHLFVVEDLHWADPSTLALLGRVVRRQPTGILTLATTRNDSVVEWWREASVLRLSPLDQSTANRLIDNLTAGESLPDDRRAVILRHAEGIPLFIEELARSSLDDRQTEPLPLRLQALLTWRLKAPGVDLRMVQVAATIGPTFDPSIVAAVLGDEEAVAHE